MYHCYGRLFQNIVNYSYGKDLAKFMFESPSKYKHKLQLRQPIFGAIDVLQNFMHFASLNVRRPPLIHSSIRCSHLQKLVKIHLI